jgi:alanine racemase
LATYAEYDLTPVVHSLAQVDVFRRYALPVRLPVYLKLNTGMNRLGFDADDLETALALLMPCAGAISLMTHFADADGETGVSEQLVRFDAMRKGRNYSISLANSAALLRYAGTRGDWARPGIMLYGSSPFPEIQSAEALGLQPVMTLSSELIAIRDIFPGDHIGYGGIFAATAPMRIGIVACGYADGYPRQAPTGTPILVDGRRTRTLGRVSMDKICVDLSDLPAANVGTPVTLWGEGRSADEVAMPAGTVSYELFCAVAARVPFAEAG